MIDIPGIRAMVEAGGYRGHTEVEILSRRWWAADPDEVMQEIKRRHATDC